MIEITQLCKSFTHSQGARRRVEVLKDIDLQVPQGQFAAIIGASGSGKSTLLGLIAGLDAPTSGSIRIDGVEITTLSEDKLAELRGRKIGYVFQSYQLIPTLTAEENVLLPHELNRGWGANDGRGPQRGYTAHPAYARTGLGALGPQTGAAPRRGRARAQEMLEAVGLAERRDHYPVQLSGGEQQRVALARAFMTRPALLLADEPTGNLDSANGQLVLELLLRLNAEQGTTLVLVTHDALLAGRAERVIEMKDGRILHDDARGGDGSTLTGAGPSAPTARVPLALAPAGGPHRPQPGLRLTGAGSSAPTAHVPREKGEA